MADTFDKTAIEALDDFEWDDDTVREGQQIWKYLDHLAATDPRKYREFLARAQKDYMVSQSPLVRLGISGVYVMRARGARVNGTATHCINICKSRAVEKPARLADDATLPIVLGERRVGQDKDAKKTYNVYDAIFHESVLERCKTDGGFKAQVVDLVVSCVRETFPDARLEKSTIKVSEETYLEPCGWDARGRAVKWDAARGEHFSVPRPGETAEDVAGEKAAEEGMRAARAAEKELTPANVLRKLVTDDSGTEVEPAVRIKIPGAGDSLRKADSAKRVHAPNATSTETVPPRKPLIEEISEKPVAPVKADYSVKENDTEWVLRVTLPDADSAADVDLPPPTRNRIYVRTDKYELELRDVPVHVDPASARARFIKAKHILVLTFTKVPDRKYK